MDTNFIYHQIISIISGECIQRIYENYWVYIKRYTLRLDNIKIARSVSKLEASLGIKGTHV